MAGRPHIRTALISYGLLFAIFAWFMAEFYHSISIDPPGSFLTEPTASRYGRNYNGDYIWGVFMVIEFLILLAVLLPHKGLRHGLLILSGLTFALIWTILLCFAFMHASPVYGIHLKWMIVACVILFYALILGFFDRRYNLPSRCSLRIQIYRGLIILFSGLLAGALALSIIIGGFTIWALILTGH